MEKMASVVGDYHAVAHVLEEGSVFLLALPKGRLSLHPCGDIPYHSGHLEGLPIGVPDKLRHGVNGSASRRVQRKYPELQVVGRALFDQVHEGLVDPLPLRDPGLNILGGESCPVRIETVDPLRTLRAPELPGLQVVLPAAHLPDYLRLLVPCLIPCKVLPYGVPVGGVLNEGHEPAA